MILAFLLILFGCNKEEPAAVSAAFTTNLVNNTVGVGDPVTVYLQDATGEFLTYFMGLDSTDSYGTGTGKSLETGTDSLVLTYYTAGKYEFTLVAISYGNWGETVSEARQSLDITVVADE